MNYIIGVAAILYVIGVYIWSCKQPDYYNPYDDNLGPF